MKNLILTTFALTGLLLGVSMYSSAVLNTNNKALAKEVELRHGADDIMEVHDDHRGRGKGGDELAQREDRRQDREHEKEIELQG